MAFLVFFPYCKFVNDEHISCVDAIVGSYE